MKRKIGSFVAVLVLLTVLLSACGKGGSNEVYSNISAQNNVYSAGTQSVLIEGNSSVDADQPKVRFRAGIAPSDIVLSEALEGKTVTKVTYNSETSITVVLSGTTKAAGGENALGCITVKHSGLESSGSSSCLVKVLAPEVRVTSMSSSQSTKDGSTVYRITASLSLPGGEFTERAVNGGITLADGVTGELSVTLSEGHLSIIVTHCSVSAPSLVIDAGATTIGKGTTIRLTVGGKAAFS